MNNFVLDSWAVMAWLKDQQPAANQARELFEAAEQRVCTLFMNIINLGEVFYLCVRTANGDYGERVLRNLRARVVTISASDALVMQAANLKARHRISYADSFAAATAMTRNLPLVTGDPELKTMAKKEKTLQLHWIAD